MCASSNGRRQHCRAHNYFSTEIFISIVSIDLLLSAKGMQLLKNVMRPHYLFLRYLLFASFWLILFYRLLLHRKPHIRIIGRYLYIFFLILSPPSDCLYIGLCVGQTERSSSSCYYWCYCCALGHRPQAKIRIELYFEMINEFSFVVLLIFS